MAKQFPLNPILILCFKAKDVGDVLRSEGCEHAACDTEEGSPR